MQTKYYLDADMCQKWGACNTAQNALGDKKLPINTRTVHSLLSRKGVGTADPHYIYRLAWPAWTLLEFSECASPIMWPEEQEIVEIARRLSAIADVAKFGAELPLNGEQLEIFVHFKNGVPDKEIVDEVVRLLNRIGDLWHKYQKDASKIMLEPALHC